MIDSSRENLCTNYHSPAQLIWLRAPDPFANGSGLPADGVRSWRNGRRATLRSLWAKARGSSSLLDRTNYFKTLKTNQRVRWVGFSDIPIISPAMSSFASAVYVTGSERLSQWFRLGFTALPDKPRRPLHEFECRRSGSLVASSLMIAIVYASARATAPRHYRPR